MPKLDKLVTFTNVVNNYINKNCMCTEANAFLSVTKKYEYMKKNIFRIYVRVCN